MISPITKKTAVKIKKLEIQGARNIAIAALRAIEETARKSKAKTMSAFLKEMKQNCEVLVKSRPTEPAMRNGLNYVVKKLSNTKHVSDAKGLVRKGCEEYITLMEHAVEKIAEIGSRRIKDGDTIMTHCHSSTVMGIIKKAWKDGKKINVICTETRPRFQGRITAKELVSFGIPTTMIVDSAARYVMNDVDLLIVGADAVTADSFIVNKIGTSQIMLAAKEARTMSCCACETFKFDPVTLSGEWETIEERDPKEVWENPPKGLKIFNPAFDFTPPQLVNFMITELGIITPYETGMIILERYGKVV